MGFSSGGRASAFALFVFLLFPLFAILLDFTAFAAFECIAMIGLPVGVLVGFALGG